MGGGVGAKKKVSRMGFSGLLPPSVSEVSSSSAQALFGHVLYFTPGDKAHAGVRCGCLGVRKIHPLRVTFGFPLGSHNWEFRRKFGPVPDPVRPNSAQIRAIFGQKVAPKVFTRLGTNLQPNLHSLGQIVSDPPPKTLSHKSTPSPSLGFFFRVGVAVLPPPLVGSEALVWVSARSALFGKLEGRFWGGPPRR